MYNESNFFMLKSFVMVTTRLTCDDAFAVSNLFDPGCVLLLVIVPIHVFSHFLVKKFLYLYNIISS